MYSHILKYMLFFMKLKHYEVAFDDFVVRI